ncbi:MAG: tRNA dihydrouridine synthase [Anaerolineae bacterium]
MNLQKPANASRATSILGNLILAPMSGYNDQPFRRLCRQLGATAVYTGLLASNAIVYGPKPLGSRRTESMLRFHPEEQPLVVQLFGSEVEVLVEAARKVESLGPAMIDINLGCAKRKVVKSGAGAALLDDVGEIGRLFAGLSSALSVPVSGKIRLGQDESSRNYIEIARVMEANGAALVAVHGRTAEQGYQGDADWDAIAEVKATVRIPVLASGDVKTPQDIDDLRAHTGCDGVMIGRAALGHPWIFQRRRRGEVPWAERVPVIQQHLDMMVDFHGAYHGVRRFRKHLHQYLRGTSVPRAKRRHMMRCGEAKTLAQLLSDALSSNETYHQEL